MVLSGIIPINQVISNENKYRHEISDKRCKYRNRDFKANLFKIKCDTYNVLFFFFCFVCGLCHTNLFILKH